jgi:hypothetical protein
MEYLATIVVRVEADDDEGARDEARHVVELISDAAETSCAWVDSVEANPEGQ